jgi:hypothetical protein
MRICKFLLIGLIGLAALGCEDEVVSDPTDNTSDPIPDRPEKVLTIAFENVWEGGALNMNQDGHINAAGNDLKPTLVDYLIANIYLIDENNQRVDIDSTWGYVSQTRRRLSFDIDAEQLSGNYSAIGFDIGLDSTTNHGNPFNFPPDHALDPMFGMHWSWASGYIFLKLEGRYTQQNGDNSAFAFHIAGLENRSSYELPLSLNMDSDSAVIHLQSDIYEMFVNPISYNLEEDGAFSHSTNDGGSVEKLLQNMTDFITVQNIEYFDD